MNVARGVFRNARREDGMTIIEVMVGIAIFFFVLTAIFGLLGATTSMAVFSNERALITNAMNTYIEEVRALPYTSVGIDGGGVPVPGTLSAESTQTIGGYLLTITPTVEWVTDDDIDGGTNHYKQLTLVGTVERGGEVVYTLSMSTFIRQEAPLGEYTPPTIEFGASSPPESSPPPVVRGNAVPIDAIASTTMPGARLVNMSFQVSPGGIFLRDQSGASAIWELDTTNATKTFFWDTLAVNEDGVPFVEDGEYTITVEVVDSNQKRVFNTRRVYIDNTPPNPPSNLVADVSASGTQVPLTWATSMDGRSQSHHYAVLVGQQTTAGTWDSDTIITEGPSGTHSLATSPFSRYYARVAAESPEGLRSEWSPSVEAGLPPIFFITRPMIGGTYQATFSNDSPKGWRVNVNLTTTQPSFPVYSVRYELYERTPTGPWTLVSAPTNSTGVFSYQYLVEANNKNQGVIDRYFKVRAYWQRNEWVSAVMAESNTLGPTSKLGEPNVITFPSPGAW